MAELGEYADYERQGDRLGYRSVTRRGTAPVTVAVLGLVVLLVLAGALSLSRTAPVRGVPVAMTGLTAPVPGAASSGEPASNRLLTSGAALPAVTCALPRLGRSPEALDAYYRAVLGCLDQAWRPVLTQIGASFASPKLEITPNTPSSCGVAPSKQEATAFYCARDSTIYMPSDRLLAEVGTRQGPHIAVLAHEYGHHVQALSGIMRAAGLKGRDFPKGSPPDRELSRRLELQANCFSGMFLAGAAGHGSVDRRLANEAVADFANTVDDTTHGTAEHQLRWGKAGFLGSGTASCNTWLAPAGEVS